MAAIQEWNAMQFKQTGQNVSKDIMFGNFISKNQMIVFGGTIIFLS